MSDQEQKAKKLIRVKSQKIEKQEDSSVLQLQESEVKKFSRND